MKLLYEFLHSFVSLIFSLLVYISYYFELTKRRIRSVLYSPTEDGIRQEASTLKNLPRHISFLILEEEIDLNILARVVIWSIAAGISYLSVYDADGVLKKKQRDFFEKVLQMRQEFSKLEYEFHFSDKSCSEQSMTNGSATKSVRKVFLSVLSKEDGKTDIVKAAKKFCTNTVTKECQSNMMDIQYFSNLLEGSKGFPDPDLAVKFGLTDSLNGYPPWQIRLTEFISIPSLCVMDSTLLLNVLQQYSRCEKRLGR